MSAAIVQINFRFNVPADQLTDGANDKAEVFNSVDGLLWKIWLINETEQATGGIYLFENRDKAQAYADGDLVADLRSRWPDVDVRVFDVMEQPSRITRAPLPGGP